ncbi:hypothetical protein [Petropleomorpha daqingensis]|uniref:Uncharacterized protein n=1 Tax=Petropleomorpha daqingensis TaxID=2026353 RepID=A0A853CKH9_9ACTN|nr:hypothetical protein [Petropleomorpha daqingensis]NYJ07042.1 hypothetical protein [Petropleomorpha daqingensis]
MTTHPATTVPLLRTPVAWGAALGAVQAASPLVFPWLTATTVYALELTAIAAIYVGFAVADGRRRVIVVEVTVALLFVVVAAVAVPASLWLVVAGLVGHGLKDLWQHRTGFVAGTRWWPPFCAAVDFVSAGFVALALVAGIAA